MKYPDTLLSCEDFVLWYIDNHYGRESLAIAVTNYARLLKSPIELHRLVPCKDGEPMEKPEKNDYPSMGAPTSWSYLEAMKEYNQALKDVWFEGIELIKNHHGLKLSAPRMLIYQTGTWIKREYKDLIGLPVTEQFYKDLLQ